MKLVPIKPKGKLFDIPRIERAVKKAMYEAAEEGKDLLERCTATWENQPTFTITEVKDGLIIGTDDPIFGYVDEGTPPHTIAPKRRTFLRFRSGYTPKTSPGQIGSGSGGASGDVVFTRKPVNHPGTRARRFTEQAQRLTQNALPVIIAQHIGGALGD